MTASGRIGQNVGALVAARGLTMVLRLGIGAYLARTLAPEGFGILGFGFSLVSYFSLAVALGLPTLGTREAARAPGTVPDLAGHILAIRLSLAAVASAVYVVVVVALPQPAAVRAVLLVQGLVLLIQALDVEWVYQGVERMGVLAVRNVVADVLQAVGVLLLVRQPDDVLPAAVASTAAAALVVVGLLRTYRRHFGRLRLHYDRVAWRALLRPALPIAASSLAISVYLNLDKLMIGLMRTQAEVGLYEAAYRLVGMSQVGAVILSQAFFPALASAWGDRAQTAGHIDAYARAMFAFGLPVTAGGALLAGPLVVLYAGPAYAGAAPALAVLLGSAAVSYLNMVYGQPLPAWDRQRAYAVAVAVGAAANFGLNLVLIPRYGIVGAAWATLIAEGLVLAGVLRPHLGAVGRISARPLVEGAGLAAVGVALPVWAAGRLGWPLPALIAAAAVGYVGTGWASGVFPAILLSFRRARGDAGPAPQ